MRLRVRNLDHGMLEGSISRMLATFRGPIPWPEVFRVLLAITLSLAFAYGIGLTGGLVTVIAVLFMPVLPHTPSLGLLRAGSAILGTAVGWALAYQFVDQPWLLFSLLMANAYFWFYMMATGFPFLTMMLMGLMPVLVGWMVYSEVPAERVAVVLAQILCGILGTEVVAFIWPNTAERRVTRLCALTLRAFSDQIRTAFGVDRPQRTRIGRVAWVPAQNVGFNLLLGLARAELGEQSSRFTRLAGLVEHVRYMMVWPKVYESLANSGHFDRWMVELEPERLAVQNGLFATVERIAVGLERGRPVEDTEELRRLVRRLDRRTCDWIEENRAQLGPENIAVIEARCHYAAVVIDRLERIMRYTRGESTPEDEGAWDLPRPLFSSILLDWNPATGVFAFKALLCVCIGFMIASLFPQWGGSLIILLMSGFLAPLTIGGLNVVFIDRMWGLLLAVPVCGLVVTVLMPNLVQIGELLVVVGIVLLPGLVLAMRPATASMGLSYAMGVLFILTSSDHPSVSLDPLQERFVSVGGATLICYIVFRIVLPSSAQDVVTERLNAALEAIAALVRHNARVSGGPSAEAETGAHMRHVTIRSGAAFDQLLEDLRWESDPPPPLLETRSNMMATVNAALAMSTANSVLVTEPLGERHPRLAERMRETLAALAAVQDGIAAYVRGDGDTAAIHGLIRVADRAILAERELILERQVCSEIDIDDPAHQANRLVLTEYAHHICMRRIQRSLVRCIQARNLLLEEYVPEAVGRTS